MSATILTADVAKKAKIELITDGKGTQAVHDVVVAMRANRRSGTASVKTKATVNLSGKKPWKQKGTGRARAGYASSPVWSGGGVVHGPHPRSYAKKTPKAVKKLAFRKALSARILSGDVLIVDSFEIKEGKTKAFVNLIKGLAGDVRRTLVVSVSFSDSTFLAARNVAGDLLMTAAEVNTENLLAFDKIIITKDALEALGNRLNG
ncbi:MAG: 50S ribosomal protein L4 [Proteobacteria bacterium]|jgi:large subunit ribosomal protein L4|nr:50S ribosomal protein L4 [Pseudomonadota bacterium]